MSMHSPDKKAKKTDS